MSAWRRTVLAAPKITALGLLVALLGVWSTAQGQPPRSADLETVRGKVDRFTTAPKGEVDGLILDDGTWVHWPPHLENRFKDIAARGDRVRVTGWTETGPKGDTKFETQTLVNQRTNASADRGDDAPPPRERRIGKGPAVAGNVETRRGMVRSFTSAPKGEVDGLVLDDGTWVHWPPHMQDRFTDILKKGDRVRATGRTETGPKGDTHFEVQSVTNLRTDAKAENPDFANGPPPPPPGQRGVAPDRPTDREQRLRDLEDQVEQLRREIQRLRRE